jgi:ABC-2 type transport system permease protein
VTRLVLAEVLKLRTTRTFWALALSTFGLVILITVLTLLLTDSFPTEDDVRSLLTTASLAGLLGIVLGTVAGAGEYRHGTIASTLLVTPNRLRAVGAQVLGCFAGGCVLGLLASAVTMAIGLPWLSAKGGPTLSTGETLGLVLGNTVYAGLAAALGVSLGALMRNQVASIVTLLVIIFVLDPVIVGLASDYAGWTLTGLSVSITGGSGDDFGSDILPPVVAALVWAGYTAVFTGAAALLTARRDI